MEHDLFWRTHDSSEVHDIGKMMEEFTETNLNEEKYLSNSPDPLSY